MRRTTLVLALSLSTLAVSGCAAWNGWFGGDSGMSFFVTSSNPGRGGDFGGLAGADRHCQALASSAGAGNKTWRAYLSTAGAGSVNARDRIGRGPWVNAKGVVVARSVEELHGTNMLSKQNSVTEKGDIISGRGDPVNMHDILTGSSPDGRAIAGSTDTTCGNWTRTGGEGSAIVGHHDRLGLQDDAPARSWNSSHATRGGCGMEGLKSTGGAGLLYCFAAN
ncbi:MAG: hypothetical protein JWP22_2487 [Ramlibacter sp.]|nr:hypothetical protein [Ramlibacter sp.]MDB5913812.1 hypothetical protein [Ramlibacter sp.]